jgi:hypothetical protein
MFAGVMRGFAVGSLTGKRGQRSLTTQQKAEITQKLTILADDKFPAPHYIAHDGFKIIAKAEVAKLSRQRPVPWDQLVNAARLIPNLSDRVFALARIAGTLTDADILQRGALLREVKTMADSIPSILDRVDRFEILADEAREVDLV